MHLDFRSFLQRIKEILMFKRASAIHLFRPTATAKCLAPVFLSNHAVACSTRYCGGTRNCRQGKQSRRSDLPPPCKAGMVARHSPWTISVSHNFKKQQFLTSISSLLMQA